ncbi:MAG: hypothetical protein AUK03_08470 [Anaerolineae bacterium CG2_30_64_16]|nr:MAG: hypothetical protein AUK03_08470 [Anaerolineae bacterium CG2_30_64_16]
MASVIPLLLAAFLVVSLTQALVTQEFVQRWLSASAGWRGILLAGPGSALVPGGPYLDIVKLHMCSTICPI